MSDRNRKHLQKQWALNEVVLSLECLFLKMHVNSLIFSIFFPMPSLLEEKSGKRNHVLFLLWTNFMYSIHFYYLNVY